MNPCLVLLAATACLAASPGFAQHARSTAATAVETVPAEDNDRAGVSTPRPKSAFGRAMAELTRAASESRTAGGGKANGLPATSAKATSPAIDDKEKSVVAKTESDDP
jgi:hypothetical protein